MIPERVTKEQYQEMLFKKCEDNHIWLNKMVYILPSDDDKIKLADMILDKLQQKSTQIPSDGITSEIDVVRELAILTPVLYLKVNWS